MSDQDIIWGYYSVAQAQEVGTLIYELVDDEVQPAAKSALVGPVAWPLPDGPRRAVYVTEVKKGHEPPRTGWDDLVRGAPI